MFFKRYPLATIGCFPNEVNRVLDDVFDGFKVFASPRNWGVPALNIWEDGDCLYAEAEVPGLTEDEIEIHVVGNELTLKGQHSDAGKDDVNYHRCERRTRSFQRTLTLPFDVQVDGVEATLKNGLLTVKLPKAQSAKSRRVTVTAD